MSDTGDNLVKTIIEKKELDMSSKLHLPGKYVFDIYCLASKLYEKFPIQINFNSYPHSGFTFKGSNFSCDIRRDLFKYISLRYEGDYNFTFKENLQEDGTYKVQVYDIDDTVTADIIYNCIQNVYNELQTLQEVAGQSFGQMAEKGKQ